MRELALSFRHRRDSRVLERVARDLIQGIPPARIFVIPFLCNDNERGVAMRRPHPIELRRRVVDFVEEGHSHRTTAAHFRVSVRFVNDMVKLKRETGSLAPKRQGDPGRGKLADVQPWVRAYVLREKDPTLNNWLSPCASTMGSRSSALPSAVFFNVLA